MKLLIGTYQFVIIPFPSWSYFYKLFKKRVFMYQIPFNRNCEGLNSMMQLFLKYWIINYYYSTSKVPYIGIYVSECVRQAFSQ